MPSAALSAEHVTLHMSSPLGSAKRPSYVLLPVTDVSPPEVVVSCDERSRKSAGPGPKIPSSVLPHGATSRHGTGGVETGPMGCPVAGFWIGFPSPGGGAQTWSSSVR